MGEEKKAARTTTKVTSVRLDRDLHKRARVYGIGSGKSLQVIVGEALAEYLKKRGA